MTTRHQAIFAAIIAGYHGDTRTYTRLLIEVRVNNFILQQAYWAGQRAKNEGIACTCLDCKPSRTTPEQQLVESYMKQLEGL